MLAHQCTRIEYPTSDGKPLGETDVHRKQIMDLISALDAHYRDQADVYVSGNLLLFYEPGNRRRHRSPDVLVSLGIRKGLRDHYLVWEEGKAPDFIIEVTSQSTRREDVVIKKRLYARLGVREYFIFDPLREYQDPMLGGFRLSGGSWIPILTRAGQAVRSDALGLDLLVVDDVLRLRDPLSGALLLTPSERVEVHQAAEAARQRAEAGREEAEAARHRAEVARQEAEVACQEAEATHQRDLERIRVFEAEVKRLRGEA